MPGGDLRTARQSARATRVPRARGRHAPPRGARLQALVGQRIERRVAASARACDARRRAAGRTHARIRRGARQEPAASASRAASSCGRHLRMTGRWSVRPRGEPRRGTPWLVLRGDRVEARALERAGARAARRARCARLGPDILDASAAARRDARAPARGRRRRARSARRSSTSARRRDREHVARRDRSGRRGSRRGSGSRDVPEDERRRALEAAARADARVGRRRPRAAARVYRRAGQAVPALRHADRVAGARRRQPHRVLVPAAARQEMDPRGRVDVTRGVRAPHLYQSLRAFCLGGVRGRARRRAAVRLRGARDAGRPSLYEYRPLVRGFVEEQAPTLRRLPDARNAIDDLRREPAAAIFARAHSGLGATSDDALFRTILLPMLTAVAERCGGFDWHDEAFDAAYADLEHSLFGIARSYAALAPLVGLSAGADVDLGGGITRAPGRRRARSRGLWPEALGLMPPRVRPRRRPALRARARRASSTPDEAEPPDAAAELADAVTALRLATAGAIAAGPVVFERLDFRPLRISPLLPIAATQPRGEADPARRSSAAGSPPTCASGCRSPTTTASSARRSTAGSSRSSPTSRSARRSCVTRSTALLGAGRRRLGRGDARGGAARREDARARAICSTALRAERLGRDGARRAAPRARRGAPPRRAAPSSSRRSTRRCSGSARGRRPCSRPEPACRAAPRGVRALRSGKTRASMLAAGLTVPIVARACSIGSGGGGRPRGRRSRS